MRLSAVRRKNEQARQVNAASSRNSDVWLLLTKGPVSSVRVDTATIPYSWVKPKMRWPSPIDDRGDAAPRDREQHQPPAMPARRQVKRAQEHRERRRRAADVGARAGRVEAERPGAARHELVLAQQLGAAGIQVSAQPERYRDRLKDRNQQEQQRQDDRKADAKRIAALATADGQRRDANRDGDHQADHAGAVDPPDGQRRPGDGSDQQDDAGGPPDPRGGRAPAAARPR